MSIKKSIAIFTILYIVAIFIAGYIVSYFNLESPSFLNTALLMASVAVVFANFFEKNPEGLTKKQRIKAITLMSFINFFVQVSIGALVTLSPEVNLNFKILLISCFAISLVHACVIGVSIQMAEKMVSQQK